MPYVFTEHGILQLANVLTGDRATQMSIRIIEVFVQMRETLTDNLSLKLDIEEIKKKLSNQNHSHLMLIVYPKNHTWYIYRNDFTYI